MSQLMRRDYEAEEQQNVDRRNPIYFGEDGSNDIADTYRQRIDPIAMLHVP